VNSVEADQRNGPGTRDGEGMIHCNASWMIERDDERAWPSGMWEHCHTDATHTRVIRMNDEVVIALKLCTAHDELWDTVGPTRIARD
jgi:hypothetical protein